MGSISVKRARKGADSEYYLLEATPAVFHFDKNGYTDDVVTVRLWHIKGATKEEVTWEYVTFRYMTPEGERQEMAWSAPLPLIVGYGNIDGMPNETTSFVVSGVRGAADLSIPIVRDGSDGKDLTIKSTEVVYQAGTSATTPPTGTWQPTVPNVTAGSYLWTRTTITFSDGTNPVVTYAVSRQGVNGTSVTVASKSVLYAVTKTNEQPADSAFAPQLPSVSQGDYLWTRTSVTFSDSSTPLVSYSVSRVGTDGESGVITHFAYATSADGKTNFSTTPFAGYTYLGVYTDPLDGTQKPDPNTYASYTWTPVKGEKGDDAVVYGIDCSNSTPNVTNENVGIALIGWRRVGNGSKENLVTGYTYEVSPNGIASTNIGADVSLTVPKGYTNAITLTVKKNDTNEVVARATITPVVNGTQGIAGVPGCTQRVFKEYIATEQTSTGNSTPMVYHNDSDEDAAYSDIRFIDIMCIRNNSSATGFDVYLCKKTHTAAATWAEDFTSENWEEVSANMVSAFFLNLIAKNATVEMLSSSCIAIMDKNGQGIRKTGMANPDDDNLPAIWAGATSNSDLTTAPFYVTNNGYLNSTWGNFKNVTITGYLGGDNGWEVTADEIKNRTSILPKITLYKDGTQFLVLGQTESMLSVRNDNGNGISILTQSASATGLNITAQGGSHAIDSYGTVNMYSRGAEHTMINSLVLGAAQASENVGMSSCSQNTSFDNTGFTGQPVAVLFTRSTTNEITVTLPSSPKIGQIAIVVQCTDKKVYINGNGKRFYHGSTYTAGMANSNTNGQWNVFIYDGSGWQSVYIQGTPF